MENVVLFKPEYERCFVAGAVLEKLPSAYVYNWSEGPVWHNDCLYFTDFANHIIYKWTEDGGTVVYRTNANRPIGLCLDNGGRIVAAESSEHRVAYTDSQKSEPIAEYYKGKRFNSPNDVIVKSDGSVWFSDPYSVAMGAERELDINGVYRVSVGGEVTLICGEIGRPNGLCFSPDEKYLYVNDTDLQQIFRFDVNEDGTVGERLTFASVDTSYGGGAVDGMKVDCEGNIWVTGPGGVWVITPTGEQAALLKCPELVGNFCFGGKDNRTLFVAATTSMYSIPVAVEGA